MYNSHLFAVLRRVLSPHNTERQNESTPFRVIVLCTATVLVQVIVVFFVFAQTPPPGSKAVAKAARQSAPSAALQTFRNVGKAYFEQGKYVEAIEQFQKVVASGKAAATDHLNLGMALMQANKLDAALGEMTTARQMDPHLVAADFNLGILYKRELRNPDAEAALKQVIAVDSQDPSTWFNLGTVYFAEKKLDESLDAYHHIIEMGFGRGQNFYVAALFRTFTALVRLKRQDDAQKVLKQWEGMHDKVPNISLQDPALEGGKYGAIQAPSPPPMEIARTASLEKVTFAEISQKLGLTPTAGKRRGFRSAPTHQGRGLLAGFRPAESCFHSSAPPSLWGITTMMVIRIFTW